MTTTTDPTAKPLTKLTVNLVPLAVDALHSAADQAGDTRTDTVNRALQVYAVVTEHYQSGGELWFVRRRTDFWGRLLGLKSVETIRFGRPGESS